jgi:hypothetical protein
MMLLLSITRISLIGAITAAVVMFRTTGREAQNRTLARDEAVRIAIQNEFGKDMNLADMYRPQYDADDWIVNNDTISPDDPLFSQRFALCVLAFATNVDGWHGGRSQWLRNISECSWSCLTCNGQGHLSGISLASHYQQSKLKSHDALRILGTARTCCAVRASKPQWHAPNRAGRSSDLKYLYLFDNPALEGDPPT